MRPTTDSVKIHAALGSAAKADVLRALRAAQDPLSARELAAAVDVPLTTLRFHLDGLLASGLIEARSETPAGRGRPRLLYAAAAAGAVRDGYRWLSGLLAGSLLKTSAATPAEQAEQAGARWVEANSPQAGPEATFEDAVETVRDVFTQFGFEPAPPVAGPLPEPVELRLHACPFVEVAREDREVVCSVHAGMMKSLLRRSGAPDAAAELRPFAEPGLCLAVIDRHPARLTGAAR